MLAAYPGSRLLMVARHPAVATRNEVGRIVLAKGFQWRARRAAYSVRRWSG